MKFDILTQVEENKISDEIKKCFEKKPKKAYFYISDLKDTGFRILEEEMIDIKTKIFFAIGVDKKNTTRIMLEDLLKYTKDVRYYINNGQIEYNSNVLIFEYTNEAVIYSFAGNFSDADITSNITFFTKTEIDLKTDGKSSYNNMLKNLQKQVEKFEFGTVTKEEIDRLVDEKEIFSTRQYVHNVKSIAELLGKKDEEEKSENQGNTEIEIPKVDLSSIDFDIDIDIPEEEHIKVEEEKAIKNNEEKEKEEIKSGFDVEFEENDDNVDSSKVDKILFDYNEDEEVEEEINDDDMYSEDGTIDINSMLFSKADLKLDIDDINVDENEEESNEAEDEILKVKKINLNAVSNFIYELPSKTSKGQEANTLKIPNYIVTMIPEFFEIADKGKNVKINNVDYKTRNIEVEIVDAKTNKKYTDRSAKFSLKKGQSFMNIVSDNLKEIEYNEKDIARIIKLDSNIYHIEIISSSMQEYKLWDKLCNQSFKSSDRRYGMM